MSLARRRSSSAGSDSSPDDEAIARELERMFDSQDGVAQERAPNVSNDPARGKSVPVANSEFPCSLGNSSETSSCDTGFQGMFPPSDEDRPGALPLDAISPIQPTAQSSSSSGKDLGRDFFDKFNDLLGPDSSVSERRRNKASMSSLDDGESVAHGGWSPPRAAEKAASSRSAVSDIASDGSLPLSAVEPHSPQNFSNDDAIPGSSTGAAVGSLTAENVPSTAPASVADAICSTLEKEGVPGVYLPPTPTGSVRASAFETGSLPPPTPTESVKASALEKESLPPPTPTESVKASALENGSLPPPTPTESVSASPLGNEARRKEIPPSTPTTPAKTPTGIRPTSTAVLPPAIMTSGCDDTEQALPSAKSNLSTVSRLFKEQVSVPTLQRDFIEHRNSNDILWSHRSEADSTSSAQECARVVRGRAARARASEDSLDRCPSALPSFSLDRRSPMVPKCDGNADAAASPKALPSQPQPHQPLLSGSRSKEWQGLPLPRDFDGDDQKKRSKASIDTHGTLVMEPTKDMLATPSASHGHELPIPDWAPCAQEARASGSDETEDNISFVCALPTPTMNEAREVGDPNDRSFVAMLDSSLNGSASRRSRKQDAAQASDGRASCTSSSRSPHSSCPLLEESSVALYGSRCSADRPGGRNSAHAPGRKSNKIRSSRVLRDTMLLPPGVPQELPRPSVRRYAGSSLTTGARRTSCGAVPDTADQLVDFLDEVVGEMEEVCAGIGSVKSTIEKEHEELMREVESAIHMRPVQPRISRPSRELIELEKYVNSLQEDESPDETGNWQTWSCFDTAPDMQDFVVATPRPLQVSTLQAVGFGQGKPPIPPYRASAVRRSMSASRASFAPRVSSGTQRQTSGAFPLWAPATLSSSSIADTSSGEIFTAGSRTSSPATQPTRVPSRTNVICPQPTGAIVAAANGHATARSFLTGRPSSRPPPSVRGNSTMNPLGPATSLFSPHTSAQMSNPKGSDERLSSARLMDSVASMDTATVSPAMESQSSVPGNRDSFRAFQKNAFRPYG